MLARAGLLMSFILSYATGFSSAGTSKFQLVHQRLRQRHRHVAASIRNIGSCSMSASIIAPSVLVTGANGGIAIAMCKEYSSRGCKVFACARKEAKELEDLKDENIEILKDVDVTSDVAVDNLVQNLKTALNGATIDILVNNAGISQSELLKPKIDIDSIRVQIEVNALGPLRLTSALVSNDLMTKQVGKIGFITSRMGSMTDNTSGKRYGYRMSKAALNSAAVSVAHDLKEDGIAVAILHPGWVQTRMTKYGGTVTPKEAALKLIERIDELTMDTTGTFWHMNGEVLPW